MRSRAFTALAPCVERYALQVRPPAPALSLANARSLALQLSRAESAQSDGQEEAFCARLRHFPLDQPRCSGERGHEAVGSFA